MKQKNKMSWSLYSLLMLALNSIGCSDIPESRQGCAVKPTAANQTTKQCYLFVRQPGKSCEESSVYSGDTAEYVIVDTAEVGPCYAEL